MDLLWPDLGFLDVGSELGDALLETLDLVVHLGDVVEEGEVLVLHLDEVRHDLVQVGIARDDLQMWNRENISDRGLLG